MTDFDHAEISRRLALAIGWPEDDVRNNDGFYIEVFRRENPMLFSPRWQTFDYRDPLIAWSVAERFNCFPRKSVNTDSGERWFARARGHVPIILDFSVADSAALAVALAVIKAKESK